MREATPQITEATLLAYADGRLSDRDREAVERYLADNPAKAAEVAHWQRQSEALQTIFPTLANEAVPARLSPHRLAHEVAMGKRNRLGQIAAAVGLLVLGGLVGWTGRDLVTPTAAANDALITSAVIAHSLYVKENRHAVEVGADDRAHLTTWLSNRVTQPVNPPDLSAEGFTLVGGRLLPPIDYPASGPAAQLMYENASAERVTVYITAALAGSADAYEFTTRAALDAFYWANETITCTVVGDLPETEMKSVAMKVYRQLTRRPDVYDYERGG
jgi:anti-sigma factor RsiW